MPDNVSILSKPIDLLAVSFFYPPANNPRAVQVARLLEHLHASTLLVCGDDYETDDRIDKNLSPIAESFLKKCLRVPFSQPIWKRATARVAYRFKIRLWERAPDRYSDWKPSVLKAIQEFSDQNHYKPALLVTFGSPMSDHLIGLDLRKRYEVPWVAHFSDPWVENPFRKHNSWTRAINLSLERKVIEAADRVVFTSPETMDLVMRKYAENLRSKGRVLSHAFAPGLFNRTQENARARIVIRYVGDLYGRRSPAPLFRALAEIAASDCSFLEDVCFEFVGSITDFKLSDVGFDRLPPGLVEFHPTVDYLKSLSLMSAADGLLVIDAPAATSVFLPSKLIDYIGAGRPVLGITPPGTAARLITELGGFVTDPTDHESTVEAVRSFITYLRDHKSDLRTEWGDAQVRERFDAGAVAAKFQQQIEELVCQNHLR